LNVYPHHHSPLPSSSPDSGSSEFNPFFSAKFSPLPLLSRLKIPYSTKWLGDYTKLYQPPFAKHPDEGWVGVSGAVASGSSSSSSSSSASDDDDSGAAAEGGGGGKEWAALIPEVKGKAWFGRVTSSMPPPPPSSETESANPDQSTGTGTGESSKNRSAAAIGDSVGFPAVIPYGIGMCIEDVQLGFGVPEWMGDPDLIVIEA
jgi:hypothetical protein